MNDLTIERKEAKKSIRCYCGNTAARTVGTLEENVIGKIVKINNAPFYACPQCGERFVSTRDRVTTQVKEAYANGLSEVEYIHQQNKFVVHFL